MDEALLIPIIVTLIVFTSIVTMIATPFYFRHRNRQRRPETYCRDYQ